MHVWCVIRKTLFFLTKSYAEKLHSHSTLFSLKTDQWVNSFHGRTHKKKPQLPAGGSCGCPPVIKQNLPDNDPFTNISFILYNPRIYYVYMGAFQLSCLISVLKHGIRFGGRNCNKSWLTAASRGNSKGTCELLPVPSATSGQQLQAEGVNQVGKMMKHVHQCLLPVYKAPRPLGTQYIYICCNKTWLFLVVSHQTSEAPQRTEADLETLTEADLLSSIFVEFSMK